MDETALIYDWNRVGRDEPSHRRVEFDDETLRDGLQSPSVIDPPIDKKIAILHLMDSIGID
ncbi:MAG TPA: 2-isopropylmalate synthase, partial [Blastocatellia bacterium]|nr:2-isopropylmalate synthase [Blastocatellia bacterium]